jgi:hypothetical protein
MLDVVPPGMQPMIRMPILIGSGHRQADRQQEADKRHEAILRRHPDHQAVGPLQRQPEIARVSDAPMPSMITKIISARIACSKAPTMVPPEMPVVSTGRRSRLCSLEASASLASQVLAQDLADVRFRQVVAELHQLGHLVGGQVFLAVGADVGLDGQAPVAATTKAFTASPAGFVGHADHGGFQNAGMRGKAILDLVGIDVEARDDDHVLLAVDDADIAVRIHGADIAGQQPAAAHGLFGFVGPVPVAQHHLRPARGDLARLALRHRGCRSARQATSVEGTGTPMELPARVLPSGLKVSTGEVSVRP